MNVAQNGSQSFVSKGCSKEDGEENQHTGLSICTATNNYRRQTGRREVQEADRLSKQANRREKENYMHESGWEDACAAMTVL